MPWDLFYAAAVVFGIGICSIIASSLLWAGVKHDPNTDVPPIFGFGFAIFFATLFLWLGWI